LQSLALTIILRRHPASDEILMNLLLPRITFRIQFLFLHDELKDRSAFSTPRKRGPTGRLRIMPTPIYKNGGAVTQGIKTLKTAESASKIYFRGKLNRPRKSSMMVET